MALEGNLKDFSLADMFRMLQTGSKSGTLHVSANGVEGLVCFRDGLVFFASCGQEAESVVSRLTSSGTISEKQLRQARGLMKIQKRDKAERKIGQILIDEGYLEANVLEGIVREQIATALFDLLRWEEGDLRFEPDEACAESDIGITVPVEDVLADARKRLEVWTRIAEKIPSMDTRFVMAPSPGTKSIDIHLKPREWLLLCYLHDGRSVSELARLTGATEFDTAKTLYGMYAGGLIEKTSAVAET